LKQQTALAAAISSRCNTKLGLTLSRNFKKKEEGDDAEKTRHLLLLHLELHLHRSCVLSSAGSRRRRLGWQGRTEDGLPNRLHLSLVKNAAAMKKIELKKIKINLSLTPDINILK